MISSLKSSEILFLVVVAAARITGSYGASTGTITNAGLAGPKKIPCGTCKTYTATASGISDTVGTYGLQLIAKDDDKLLTFKDDEFDDISLTGTTGESGDTWSRSFEFEICCDEDCHVVDEKEEENVIELFITAKNDDSEKISPVKEISCCERDPGVCGDPHFYTWAVERYSYHGQCDLVLVHSDSFAAGMGLDVHVRTQIRQFYSFIDHVAIKIGENILEIQHDYFFLDGQLGDKDTLPITFAGFRLIHSVIDEKRSLFTIDMGNNYYIKVRIYRSSLSVSVVGNPAELHDSTGMLGRYSDGAMIARDGVTVIEDPNEFGAEWQVWDTEPKLFVKDRHPQFPARCILPDAAQTKRKLRMDQNKVQEAETACEKAADVEACVFDVLATGDIGMATATDF